MLTNRILGRAPAQTSIPIRQEDIFAKNTGIRERLIRFLSLDFSVPTQTVDLEFIFCQVNANR